VNNSIELSPDETAEVQAQLDVITATVGFAPTLDTLLTEWAIFVARLEVGYEDSIYDYLDDLATRDLLQQIVDAASPTLRQKLASTLEPWDARFTQTTHAVEDTMVQIAWNGDRTWDRRVPNVLTGDLARDLRSAGFAM
jgi:hypothetical protein